jgi:hypothetical protein
MNPCHTEIHDTDCGRVYIRVDQTFYSVDERGHTIDGPMDNLEDAIETGVLFNRMKKSKAARFGKDRSE